MSPLLRRAAGMAVAVMAAGSAIGAVRAGRPAETLGVRDASGWVTWWRRDAAPAYWGGETPLAGRVVWRPGAAGVEWGELGLRGASEAWRTRVIIVRLDPGTVGLVLATAFTGGNSWTIDDAGSGAVLALVTGQFRHALPWGWVVSQGRELLPPEYAPLAGAVVVDSSGAVRVVAPDRVETERARGTAREAFQSYPMLLQGGVVPLALREPGGGVNLAHRDSRLALCTLPDGRVTIALTRFDGFGESLGRVPFGLTSPEMAAVMGALGCRDALLLDGGISGQLLVREAAGSVRSWRGSRSVPLGLLGLPRR